MKSYLYNEPVYEDVSGEIVGNTVVEMTEEQILAEYWDHWSEQMVAKYGAGHYLIIPENCIEDWVTVSWAWEKTPLVLPDDAPGVSPMQPPTKEFMEMIQSNKDNKT